MEHPKRPGLFWRRGDGLHVLALGSLVMVGATCCHSMAGVPTQHIVMFDSHGKAMDPTGKIDCEEPVPPKVEARTADQLMTPGEPDWNRCNGKISRLSSFKQLDSREFSKYLDQVFRSIPATPGAPSPVSSTTGVTGRRASDFRRRRSARALGSFARMIRKPGNRPGGGDRAALARVPAPC
ncbi:MAG TPA: hypothetical protein VEL74_07860 [Thermoanaerobaculia bacterium]|nr:hypothetical protein [Thermoanaerobaculia bacterium]